MTDFKTEGNELNDGIDRAFEYPPYVFELIDAAEAQRTHKVVQNGFSSISYPNLTHPRKVHLLGTAKNSLRMLRSAAAGQGEKIDISLYEAIVGSAASLHDIGHSAFSHDLEALISRFTKKSHEQVAAEMIVGEYSLLQFYEELEGIISPIHKKAMIKILKEIPKIPEILNHYGVPLETVAQIIDEGRAEREGISDRIGMNHFLRELINGIIDGDKFDYLERDPRNAGITETKFSPEGLISVLGITKHSDGYHLAIADTGIEMFNQLLTTRAYMYSRVYTHKTVLKIQAMKYEACKRFLMSLGEKAEKYGQSLHLLDDTMFEAFITANSKDPIATELFMRAEYDRRGKYDIAFRIESKDIPLAIDSRKTEIVDTLQKLYNVEGEFREDIIRDKILEIANAGNEKKLKDYEIIVYFPYPRKLKDKTKLTNAFKLYVYEHRTPENVYLASEKIQDINFFDERLTNCFRTFCRHQTSNYFLVLTPKQHKTRVKRATEEYIKKELKA